MERRVSGATCPRKRASISAKLGVWGLGWAIYDQSLPVPSCCPALKDRTVTTPQGILRLRQDAGRRHPPGIPRPLWPCTAHARGLDTAQRAQGSKWGQRLKVLGSDETPQD